MGREGRGGKVHHFLVTEYVRMTTQLNKSVNLLQAKSIHSTSMLFTTLRYKTIRLTFPIHTPRHSSNNTPTMISSPLPRPTPLVHDHLEIETNLESYLFLDCLIAVKICAKHA